MVEIRQYDFDHVTHFTSNTRYKISDEHKRNRKSFVLTHEYNDSSWIISVQVNVNVIFAKSLFI